MTDHEDATWIVKQIIETEIEREGYAESIDWDRLCDALATEMVSASDGTISLRRAEIERELNARRSSEQLARDEAAFGKALRYAFRAHAEFFDAKPFSEGAIRHARLMLTEWQHPREGEIYEFIAKVAGAEPVSKCDTVREMLSGCPAPPRERIVASDEVIAGIVEHMGKDGER